MGNTRPAHPTALAPPRARAFVLAAALCAALFLLLSGAGQARAFLGAGPQWYWLGPQPQGNDLRDVTFVGSQRGWAVGYNGTVLATGNGGATWKMQTTGTTAQFMAVSFATRSFGVAVGEKGTIRRTTDGGRTWRTAHSGTDKILWDVCFPTTNRGWAVGDDGLLLTSADGGTTWRRQDSTTEETLRTVVAVDATHAWAAGDGASLLRTTDGGRHWQWSYLSGGSTRDWIDQVFTSRTHGWAVNYWGVLAETTDGGETWQDVSPPVKPSEVCSLTVGDGRQWITARYGLILSRTLPDGAWEGQTSNTGAGLYGLAVRAPGQLVAVGEGGTMLTSTNDGADWGFSSRGWAAGLADVCFTSPTTGFAAGSVQWPGNGQVIYATFDGGQTWEQQLAGGQGWLGGVAMADHAHGWMVGWNGAVWHTTDGGILWTDQSLGKPINLQSVACIDDQNAWTVGSPYSGTFHNILRTTDGGTTWTEEPSAPTTSLEDITFVDATHGWAVGDGGVISAWDGSTWSTQVSGVDANLYAVFFADALHGWAVGYGTIIATADGGQTWVRQAAAFDQAFFQDVIFVSPKRGWAIDQSGPLLSTTDGGGHWRKASSGGATYPSGAFVLDATHAWIVGGWGQTLGLDVVRPVVGAKAPSGVQHRAVTVKITASDSQSSVAAVQYRIGRGPWKTGRSAKVTASGTTVVSYRATDNAANVSAVRKITVRISR